ncbi:TIGR00153 family protein [Aliikangiella sp. G2MR2-5]|uniref:TIGR00153 family protein n=1 Tax=Aliikangiella sp. G2MR2-5 TaxID=2788943 RepID=UPI0018A883F5|nr:TIGR00153 family protein [Aliikangiella sp. G2MR2-5]
MNPILDLFASSPMKPLQTHMQKVQECVDQLPVFIDAVFAKNWEQVEQTQKHIRALENEADELKKALRLHLPTGLFMPVARADLLALLASQDKIANKAKDVAGLITGRQMSFPESLENQFKEYIQKSVDTAHQAGKAIQQLDELLESGFKGKEVTIAEEMVEQLDALENESDVLQIKLRRSIFNLEKELPPVDVIFMYKTIDWIGDLSDLSQQVGSRLELLLAR